MRLWFYIPSFIAFTIALWLSWRLIRHRPRSEATVDAANWLPWAILTWCYCLVWLVSALVTGSTAGSDTWATWASAVRLSGSLTLCIFLYRKCRHA